MTAYANYLSEVKTRDGVVVSINHNVKPPKGWRFVIPAAVARVETGQMEMFR